MANLKAKRIDLSRRVTREEDRGMQRLAEFQVWLDNVETNENKVSVLINTRNVELQRLCLCQFCCKSLISSYGYGESVFLALVDVEKLERRVFEVVCEQTQRPEVEELPLQRPIVGQKNMLDKAWKHLREDEVGIMGMYGMGGVGKTTLLRQLNNKFSEERCGVDFVIWVVVSKDLDVEKIQNEIAKKVGLGGEKWNQADKSQKAVCLYNFLLRKKFVLFLDDIWEKVDLDETGVPFPTTENKCKVAFTTRSQDVCAHMGVEDPMEVQCISEYEALDLFHKKVGQVTLGSDPDIPHLARTVARKCRGLPLALNVIGETMSCKRTVPEWNYAIEVLTSYASQFPRMDKILPILKYSFDNLKEDHLKSCLLYFALFPEDYRIEKAQLIYYWICEGLIDGSEDIIGMAENKGYEIIGSLVRASLLMEDGKNKVCMHDVIRGKNKVCMQEKDAFIVHASVGFFEMPKVKNWNTVKRMSLMYNKIPELGGSLECLQLTTLLLQKADLRTISNEFFKSMPNLVVLDLSHNQDLSELPDSISELGSLLYLNLSETGIHQLPVGLHGLRKLIYLDLWNTPMLSSIVGISRLQKLKVLRLLGYNFSLDLQAMKELETLEHLECLFTTINSYQELGILSSHKLTSCTRDLDIFDIDKEKSLPVSIALPVTMNKLRSFCIHSCNIPEINMVKICIKRKTISLLDNPSTPCFSSLSKVKIHHCKSLWELTFLLFASNLKELDIKGAILEDIINKDKASKGEKSGIVPFPKLIFLNLDSLPRLMNIHWKPLPFPCLREIRVMGCPNLKKLPLDSDSSTHGENGLVISYNREEWIEGLEWKDEATKTRFL